MTITVYTFRDADDNEFGCFKTQDYREAIKHASERRLKVIANEFEWSDSWIANDFTAPKSADKGCQECDGSGTDDDGAECPGCQGREVCPRCGEPIEYVEPTPADETYRQCSASCGWRLS